jgi:DNA-binding NarL/FixJ family response regulator
MSSTVLIAESNPVFLEALSAALSILSYSVVGTTSEKSEVAALAQQTQPDLLLYDFNLSDNGIDGLADVKRLKAQMPKLKVLVIGYLDWTAEFENKLREAGLDGFWNKYDSHAGFQNALKLLDS